MACLFGHKWDGCKCTKCGKTRDIEHEWSYPKREYKECVKCGKTYEYNALDMLGEYGAVLLMFDASEKYGIACNDQAISFISHILWCPAHLLSFARPKNNPPFESVWNGACSDEEIKRYMSRTFKETAEKALEDASYKLSLFADVKVGLENHNDLAYMACIKAFALDSQRKNMMDEASGLSREQKLLNGKELFRESYESYVSLAVKLG